jgi:hypothetical protein
MELLLALAAVIVAAATLFVAYVARRRFNAYELSVASLTSGQQELKGAAARGQAAAQDVEQVREAVKKLAERHERDKQTLADEVSKTVDQLRTQVAVTVEEQRVRLDALVQHGADHDSRLNSLDQLAAERKSDLVSLDHLAPDVMRWLDDLAAQAVWLKEEAGQQAAALRALSDGSTSTSARAAETLTGLSDQLLALAANVELLDLDRRELRAQLRKWLAYSARQTRTAPAAVMPGFIQANRRAASEILPCFYEALLKGVGLDCVFRDEAGSAGVFYYLISRSPDGQPVEQQLGNLLTTCRIPDADSQLPGLTELRSLLLTMYVGGPATMRLGPLVSHAAEGMFRGVVLTAGEVQTLDAGDPISSPIRYARRLGELPEDRVLDLAAWAASNS